MLWNLKPRTRGTVSVTPGSTIPKIDLNLFADGSFDDPESDLSSLIDGMRWMYTVVQELQKTYPTLVPVFPPVAVLEESDPAVLEVYIKKGLSLTDHYCSTCKLGTVVDPNTFLLNGTENIHVVDTSTFPSISDGNTCYPCIVMAEIAAKRIGDLMS